MEKTCKYHVKTRARDFTNLLAKSEFCQQMCEILSPFVDAASTNFLLNGSSLPPDLPAECEIHSHCFHKVVTPILLNGGSLPPDFARRLCQTNYNANKERIC